MGLRSAPLFDTTIPLLGVGMVSLVLGSVGLLLFFLPILSLPIAGFGLLFGVIGVFAALFGPGNLRWSLGGITLSGLAAGVALTLMATPEGEIISRSAPGLWRNIPGQRYVAPPAGQGDPDLWPAPAAARDQRAGDGGRRGEPRARD